MVKRLLKDVEASSSSSSFGSSYSSLNNNKSSSHNDQEAMNAIHEIRRNKSKLCVPSLNDFDSSSDKLAQKKDLIREIRRLSSKESKARRLPSNDTNKVRFNQSLPVTSNELNYIKGEQNTTKKSTSSSSYHRSSSMCDILEAYQNGSSSTTLPSHSQESF